MAVFGAIGKFLFGGGGNKKESSEVQNLNNQLSPLVELQKEFAKYGFPAAQKSFGQAGAAYDTSLDFYRKILSGSNSDLLGLINADEYTKSADEAEAGAYNLAGRSGSRAATLAGVNESRSGNLNRILSELKLTAPDKIASLAQAISNMGAQQASLATGTSSNASNTLFGIQNFREAAADRRAQMISSIIGAAGSAAGAAFAFSDENLKENIKPISDIREKLEKVHGVSFNYSLRSVALGLDPNRKQAGILANQVYQVFPDLVEIDNSGYKKVNYTALTALLTDELKVMDKENNLLKAMTSFNIGVNANA